MQDSIVPNKLDQVGIRERIHIAFKCVQNIHHCVLYINPHRKPQQIPRISIKVRLSALALYKIK